MPLIHSITKGIFVYNLHTTYEKQDKPLKYSYVGLSKAFFRKHTKFKTDL